MSKSELKRKALQDDCISRKAAIDALRDATFDFETCEIVLKQLPSAQPEIITCEHCSKCQKDDVFLGYWCEGKRVRKDHYCGYAKRRTDEQT